MSAILLDGQLVHYEVLGRGRPVIFLHGWLGSWRYWISSLQVTSTSYRAYAIDLWGYGDSPHVENRYGVYRQAELLKHFLSEMGMAKVALVGHGLGALVAMAFALRMPDAVNRMMLVGCPLRLDDINTRLRSDDLNALAGWLLPGTPEYESIRLDLPKQSPDVIKLAYQSLQNDSGFFMHVREIRIPTLFVSGFTDPLVARSESVQENMRYNFHEIVLENSGHFPMIDESARFHRLLADFLALESGDSPRELQLKEEWKRRVR